MTGRIEVIGERVRLSGPAEGWLELSEETRAQRADWTGRYRAATGPVAPGVLFELGRELWDWLDGGGWARAWANAGGPPARDRGRGAADGGATGAARSARELLADASVHLAADAAQPFEVWRRVGLAGAPREPQHRDLSLLFMAAAPRGGGAELDYEGEEAAILRSTASVRSLALSVEESGCAGFLRDRLDGEEAFEAIHLSGHGTLIDAAAAQRLGVEAGPASAARDPRGATGADPARAARRGPGARNSPALGLLRPAAPRRAPMAPRSPSARTLARAVPAVLGWDGSVYDPDAIAFAEVFYR